MYFRKNQEKKSAGWFSGIIKLLNILAIAGLLLAYAGYHVSPLTTLIPVFFGLTYPFWLVLNMLFVIFWLFRKKVFLVLSLLAIIIGWSHVGRTFRPALQSAPQRPDTGIHVMSYNVKLFDIYNFRKDTSNKTHKKIYQFLNDNQPAILCLQEFYTEDTGSMAVIDSILAVLPDPEYHIDFFQTLRKEHHWGIATFSTFPVINRQRHQFRNSAGNYCILTDILYKKDTLRIINTHMESWHFEKADLALMQDVKSHGIGSDTVKQDIKNVYWKIENAFMKRAVQARELEKIIIESPYPALVCGDFNGTPLSYTYKLVNKHLNDAFVGHGRGFGKTFRDGLPYFRIDYIFYDDHFKPLWFNTYPLPYSDHHPVSAVFTTKSK
ncbi:MAG: endonuclease/exonuclease/phosphatase family protein [Bacteroidota bacterium]